MSNDESADLTKPKLGDVQIRWGVRFPLRDGVELSAILYLPVDPDGPAPAIFTMTPYIAQSHHQQGVYYAARGYPFLSVDVRGRGNSEGRFHPRNEAEDGYDIVEWLAQQPYCNGKVAGWGLSYMGYCQWAAARERPPHLATIVPAAAPFRGVDSPLRNNVFTPYTMQWLMVVAGRTSQERMFVDRTFWNQKFRQWFEAGLPFRQLDTFLGNSSSLFQEWISHPHRDAYWDSYNPTAEQYAKLALPILTITGIYDADQLGALAHYREHMRSASAAARAEHYLVIGPWDHSGTCAPKAEFGGIKVGPAGLLDLAELHAQWYAWRMRGAAKPAFLRKKVAYYVMGAETWRYADTLEAVTARFDPLRLQVAHNPTDVFHSGVMTRELPSGNSPHSYIYDPRDLSLAQLESTVDSESLIDQRMVLAGRGRQLVYHSALFTESVEIAGFFRLLLWLSIDQPDTDVRACVYEVAPDGSAIILTADWIRARYRESFREEKLIDTHAPLNYRLEHFQFVSRRLDAGSRLRLVIGPLNSIHWQKNYNSGGVVADETVHDARTVTVKLFSDAEHPSTLYVPLGVEAV